MGPSAESLALADFLISKLGLQIDRISLAYAIMDHVEVEYADELAQPSPGGQGELNYERMFVDACAALAEVSRELGCDPEQGGAEPILAAIAELRAALAARQPVGEQCAALWIQFAENGNIRFWTKDQNRALAESFLHARPLTAFYASPQQPAQGVDLGPRPMDTAPRDGTMVRLLVQFEENATEDTAEPAWTIGACNDDNVGDEERIGWQFAGWCWTHDHFTEGKGTPVGWLPLIEPAQAVDLGEVRKCADEAVEFINHGYGGHARRKIQELLALIDRKADAHG